MDVYEFDPQVYPIKFWVLINPTQESIDKTFKSLDGSDNKYGVDSRSCYASVWSKILENRQTGKWGFILCVNSPKEFTPDKMTHEAVHLAGELWNHIEAEHIYIDDEPNAYLTGWFVECMIDALKDYKSQNKKKK